MKKFLKQLQETDNGISLKTNHAHYHQMQGQLGISNNAQSWYFVFTHHRYYIEKIAFDKMLFEMMLTNLKIFWFQRSSIQPKDVFKITVQIVMFVTFGFTFNV